MRFSAQNCRGRYKKAGFTERRIVNILKLIDSGMKVDDLYRQRGISVPLAAIGNQSTVVCNPMMLNH